MIKNKKILKGLDHSQYEHPFDQKALSALQSTPGVDLVGNFITKHTIEKIYTVQYTGSNLKVTSENYPKIYEYLQYACQILDLPKVPELYIEWGYSINAFTVGSENPIIVLNSGLIDLCDDDWAWMLAMNESIEEYNSRLGRKIGSVDAACNAVDELINIYNAGNQPELNTASYVESILMHYKAVYAYHRLIEFIDDCKDDSDWDLQLRAVYYREFKEWFDINNAVNGIMYFYTYAAAGYSALSMDLNGTFEIWSRERLAELEIERDIYWSFDWKPFESESKAISPKKFDKLLDYFKTRTDETVVKEMVADWAEKDYDYARERIDGKFDFDKITEMLRYYETALTNWREVREQITQMLPKEKQKSYREITKLMHTRLYNDLVDLKEIKY